MIFKDLPEFVNEETVFQTISFGYDFSVEERLDYIENRFANCFSATFMDKANILQFWNGDILMFAYREDGVKLITLYSVPERDVMVIYDKDIYDFVLKQGMEDNDEDYVVPKLNKAKFEPMKEEIKEKYISSSMHEYCVYLTKD